MRDGSFLRLKQLEIGYTIPEKVTNKVGIKNLRFYVTGKSIYYALVNLNFGILKWQVPA